MRGFAALLVVVQHAGYYAVQTAGAEYSQFIKVDFGTLGVLMFFTISGFVIGLNRHLPTYEFVARRALRIYPAFWAAYALSALFMLTVGKETGVSWAAALLLPSRGYPAIYLPMWTLVFEVFFYALAAAVFALRLSDRALTGLAMCWILFIQNMQPYMTGSLPFLPGALIPFAQYNVFFALGLICAVNFDLLSRAPMAALLTLAIGATALLPLLPPAPHATTSLVLGVGLSTLVLVLTQIEGWPRIVTALGNASYGMFLLHFSIIAAATVFLAGYGFSVWTLWVILFGIGLAGSLPFGLAEFAFHRSALRKVLRLFRGEPATAGS